MKSLVMKLKINVMILILPMIQLINNIVNTESNDLNIIKSVCVDELSETDKTVMEGVLFTTSDNPISDSERIKREEYARNRRERRLEKIRETNYLYYIY